VESGVQPKGGAPISAIEAQGWAHISRQMVAEGEIKEGAEGGEGHYSHL
jgi:hypothetical protein